MNEIAGEFQRDMGALGESKARNRIFRALARANERAEKAESLVEQLRLRSQELEQERDKRDNRGPLSINEARQSLRDDGWLDPQQAREVRLRNQTMRERKGELLKALHEIAASSIESETLRIVREALSEPAEPEGGQPE